MRKFIFAIFIAASSSASSQEALTDTQLRNLRGYFAQQLNEDADNRLARFRYAQVSFQSEDYDAARYHISHLRRTPQSETELETLNRAYADIVEEDPWSFTGRFSLLPSTNINRASSNIYFDTSLGTLIITNGGQEESGVGLQFGGTVAYETAFESRNTVTYAADLDRYAYPVSRLNRTRAQARVSWAHYGMSGATRVTPYFQRTIFASSSDSSDSSRYGLSGARQIYLNESDALTFDGKYEWRDYDTSPVLSGSFSAASVRYDNHIAEGQRYSVRLSTEFSRPEGAHHIYDGASVWAEYAWSNNDFGFLAINATAGFREYDGVFPGLTFPREDQFAGIGFAIATPKLQIRDLTPKLSCQFQETRSNVDLYDFNSTDCAISFNREF